MGGRKGRSGRRRARYTEEGDQLVRTDIYVSKSMIERLREKNINLSQFTRRAAHLFLSSPFDIDREETERKIREKEIELSILRDHLNEINSKSEIARQLLAQKEKDAPTVNLIISRIEKIINPEILGTHLASHLFDVGIVERASAVNELREEWVRPIFPFVSGFILDDVGGFLDSAALDWPKSYTREEAVRYALVDVCKFSSLVLNPMTPQEKLGLIKKSMLKRFPTIDQETKKEASSRLDTLLKAYSIDRSTSDLMEKFYSQKSAEIGES